MIRKIVFSVLTMTVLFRAPVTPDLGVETMVSEFSSQTGCENVSVVVYDNGDFSYYGDSEGLYQIGSMTKSFTGLAVQKLINEGTLSGQDTVSDLTPGFKAFYDSSETETKVEDLLKQRSGYTNSETDFPSATEDMTLQEWAESISGKELKSMPGTECSYSNVNYNLLGVIIENVTGISYREYMADIDSSISETDLVRISRTCFMNVSYIKEIMQIKNSHLEAVLDNGEKLIVSRKYLKDIKKIFRRKLL